MEEATETEKRKVRLLRRIQAMEAINQLNEKLDGENECTGMGAPRFACRCLCHRGVEGHFHCMGGDCCSRANQRFSRGGCGY